MMQRIVNQAAGLFAGAMLVILALLASSSAGARMPQAEVAAPVVEPLAVSQVFHYQGRLLTPGTGEPKADGTYQMSFSIYNVASGGSPLWTENKPIQVTNGAFSTLLGDTTPLPLGIFDGQELFLGVTLVGDPEATPRQRLAHVAYAMRAETAGSAATANNADTLDGQDSTAFISPKFLSLDPFAAHISGSTFKDDGFGPHSGIHLPDTGDSAFAVGFTLPPNYTTGTTVVMRMMWHVMSPAANCGVSFNGNYISVARPGRTHIVGTTTDTGITIVGGNTLTAPSVVQQSSETLINIVSPLTSVPLQAGD
ncbi:MAG TPA: hypothetical protein VNK95_20450, partial [Caldilineaceae bacterium]|nr:hypothetical protein [Caldilineaceae bacterium]